MKRINQFLTIALSLLLFVSCENSSELKTNEPIKVELKDGFYFINGEKTFINAIGYQVGARPGQHPKEDEKVLLLDRMKYDLNEIKKAGYNTIRTWDELTEEEVQLVQESGLFLIYGIEINQYGDWKNPEFINHANERTKKALAFTKKYDCIITYLIMNEPMTGHIQAQGGEAALNLWTGIINIIHNEHSGIPVSMSPNSRISEWQDENFLDVNGFNIYNYIEDQIYTQGFGGHIKWLREKNDKNKPFLITEFGMSISKYGNGLYGGNTIKTQTEWVVNDYVQVLDGGVNGACPFYYADGWWKAGKPAEHDPYAEEWFGFRGYANINDTLGYPRPVWHEMSEYIQGIITSPRNQRIYGNEVPVEIFFTDRIKEFRVIYMDQIILKQELKKKHVLTSIDFGEEEMTDRELVFEFYDKNQNLVKYETIMILTSYKAPILPTILVDVKDDDLNNMSRCDAKITLKNDSPFKLDQDLKYVFSPHIGWEAGHNKTITINPDKSEQTFKVSFKVPEKSPVLNVSAGIDVKFGKFTTRISDVELIYRGDWADPIKID